MKEKLLLLMGPSGCGKSTLIRALAIQDARFSYVRPFITRDLREGEVDKIPISDAELALRSANGEFLVVNELYGVKYATPKGTIEECWRSGGFPMLDWPITHLNILQETFPGKLCRIYVRPPSVAILAERLRGRNEYEARLAAARLEWAQIESHEFDEAIDAEVITYDERLGECIATIVEVYYASSANGGMQP